VTESLSAEKTGWRFRRSRVYRQTMSAPLPPRLGGQPSASSGNVSPQQPEIAPLQESAGTLNTSNSTLRPDAASSQTAPRKKRNHRGGKKKRLRRKSFAVSTEDGHGMPETTQPSRPGQSQNAARSSFYRLHGQNLSNTSLESEALLDHRSVITADTIKLIS
jgi:magnesium transporter